MANGVYIKICPVNFNFGLYWSTVTPALHKAQTKCCQLIFNFLFIRNIWNNATILAHGQNLTYDLCKWHQWHHSCLESIAFAWEGCLMPVFLSYDTITENSPIWLCSWMGTPISNKNSLGIPCPATSTCRNACRPSCKVPIFCCLIWTKTVMCQQICRISQHQILWKYTQQFSNCHVQTDRHGEAKRHTF